MVFRKYENLVPGCGTCGFLYCSQVCVLLLCPTGRRNTGGSKYSYYGFSLFFIVYETVFVDLLVARSCAAAV